MQTAALVAAALMLFAAALPASAQDMQVAEVPSQAVQAPAIAELPFSAAQPVASPALTAQMLSAYVARQQAKKGFDIFGAAPQPQLTTAVLSAYAATHFQNAALTAIDNIASASTPLGANFSAQDASALTEDGQWAVANVIINRALSKRFPTTMCGVVYQNANQGLNRCQFTFACNGQPDMTSERQAWVKANRIADAAFSEFQHGQRPGVVPGSALYYHTTSVTTDWGFKQVAQIGQHVFYSPM
jgi:spore germination cell wall hydrolase CwlJ-like protein